MEAIAVVAVAAATAVALGVAVAISHGQTTISIVVQETPPTTPTRGHCVKSATREGIKPLIVGITIMRNTYTKPL